jgi:predicted short-subunit dehydrogenase-like oxidoreductase (DUF2520 family)
MAATSNIAIVGPGRFGTALARALIEAGHNLSEIVSSKSKTSRQNALALAGRANIDVSSVAEPHLEATTIWLCVPDQQIEDVAKQLASAASWKKRVVFHSSGALTSDALNALRQRGAAVASVHPVMTFVHGSIPSFTGIPFGIEGDAAAVRAARRIIADLGGQSFTVRKRDKALYHVWGMFISPLLLSLVVTAQQIGRAAGVPAKEVRKKMIPIMTQTLANYVQLGPAGSFSGPLVRGDVATIKKHLQVLKRFPEARESYVALARSALRQLPVRNRGEIAKVLRPSGHKAISS